MPITEETENEDACRSAVKEDRSGKKWARGTGEEGAESPPSGGATGHQKRQAEKRTLIVANNKKPREENHNASKCSNEEKKARKLAKRKAQKERDAQSMDFGILIHRRQSQS